MSGVSGENATDFDHDVSFREAARFWVKLGFINFGGPTGQIAIMHDELVDRRRWISTSRFLHALNYCMLLPGPEAQQLAIYVGWLLHKVKGGLVAGIAFIVPAFILIMGLSWVYVAHGDVTFIAGIFSGLQAAVVGIVAAAVIRIGSKALRNGAMVAIAAGAFLAIFFVHVPFPLIILAAGLIGFVGRRFWAGVFTLPEFGQGEPSAIRDDGPVAEHTKPSSGRAVRVLTIGLAAWIVPLAVVAFLPGTPQGRRPGGVLLLQGGARDVRRRLCGARLHEPGGGPAVRVARPAKWRPASDSPRALPGRSSWSRSSSDSSPRIRVPAGCRPVLAGVLGATVTTWATFAPCFLWIFLGAPYIERLRGNRSLTATLSAITAAVVGVILNLAVTFGVETLFTHVRIETVFGGPVPVPVLSSVDAFAVVVAAASFVALWRFRVSVLWVVGAAALAGVLHAVV